MSADKRLYLMDEKDITDTIAGTLLPAPYICDTAAKLQNTTIPIHLPGDILEAFVLLSDDCRNIATNKR